ncbi:MAG: IclR family transcriptional regulator [Clostridia bacterium]|nr:IclR family transcriptional regulator [Clostridia bacterium]
MEMATAKATNRSLARGLDMLELLGKSPRGLALHEITRALALPKSSASNLVHTLLDKRFAHYDADTQLYSLSLRAFEVGAAALAGVDIESVLRAHMREIADECDETVHCGVPDGTDVVYVDKIESTRSIRMASRIGARMPLYCTAMGRAILACLPNARVAELLAHQRFEPLTPHTISSPQALLRELDAVRARGYAGEREETNESVCCVGVALRGREGTARYAISISAPTFRAGDSEMSDYARLLLRAQGKMERYLRAL